MEPDTQEDKIVETPEVETVTSPLKQYQYLIFGLVGLLLLVLIVLFFLIQEFSTNKVQDVDSIDVPTQNFSEVDSNYTLKLLDKMLQNPSNALEPCKTQDILTCFGSGRQIASDLETETYQVYALISTDETSSYGLINKETGLLSLLTVPADDSDGQVRSEVVEITEKLSSFTGIRSIALETIDVAQMGRFGYIKTPTNKVAFVDWPSGRERSYESLMDYIKEKSTDPERIFKEIQNSDPATFKVFNLEEHVTPFAKDQNHFYMFGSVVPELDPNTVKIFKLGSQQTWSKDESKPNISSGATFLATDSDTAYFLGRFGPHWSLQTFLPGVLEGANPENLSILSDEPSFTLITTDGEKVYWNTKLLNGITPENFEISGKEVKSSDGQFTYIDGRPEKDFIATSEFGEQISDAPNFSPATFIYNDSGEPRTLTTEYKTTDGNYLVKTETSDETHRGGIYIYDANSGELLHEAELKSQLAGYRMIATSPDERFMYAIVGLYEFGSYSKLYKIEIATGAVTEVSGVSTMNTYESLKNSSGLSSDGSKLIFTESSDNSYPACTDFNRLYDTIKLLDLSEGTVTTLYQAEPSQHITEITWLPAENGFTYAIQESYSVENYVGVAPLDKKPNVPLIMNAYLAPCQNGYTNKLSYYRYLF